MRLILATGLVAAPAMAQVTTGNVRGTVVDTSREGSRVSRDTHQHPDGRQRVVTPTHRGFQRPFDAAGRLSDYAEIAGFQKKHSGVNLQVDQTAVIRIVLEPGAVTQQVEVTSARPLLDAQTSSLGQVIETSESSSCPSTAASVRTRFIGRRRDAVFRLVTNFRLSPAGAARRRMTFCSTE